MPALIAEALPDSRLASIARRNDPREKVAVSSK
jgi:hypothetical protein